MRLFPKEIDFFEIFEKASRNLINASSRFVELAENFDDIESRAKSIYELEQEGDLLTHETIRRLNKTFLTPIDREDIHALASRIDDVLDLIWAAADRFVLFKVDRKVDGLVELSKSLKANTEAIYRAIRELKAKKYSYVQDLCIEINRLENEADRIFRDAIGRMFENEKDPIFIIKWKEILEHLEDATDICEDVANILEGIVLKNA
ncbi:putative pit accessory protein [bacterium BMS3Abin07]|nr:putative pit accessory protein [bacterium BMS3Abin07]GBE32267.1 putative pit accessory protein [bacterium BMS3Bbin05]